MGGQLISLLFEVQFSLRTIVRAFPTSQNGPAGLVVLNLKRAFFMRFSPKSKPVDNILCIG